MLTDFLTKLFGSRNQRLLKQLYKRVEQINALEAQTQALSDEQLAAKTVEFRARLAKGETLDDLLPEAFAVVRVAGQRTLGMRHFDVQMVGANVLHQGKIAEMKTGEGKTLVSTLAAYLNALEGKGVHIITVNDYLAQRDADSMGRLHRFLGLTVGVILSGQSQDEKRAAYACDITYGTNNEFGFDYLRDNMAFSLEDKVQRGQHYGIIDEVDSILIDEARTPLIISGPTDDDPALYVAINQLIPQLKRQTEEESAGDFFVDEKGKQIHLSEDGNEKIENLMRQAGLLGADESLYDSGKLVLVHHLNALLRAHHLYQRDVEYIVEHGEIVIIDDFTGRKMAGRRWSDGLHQAIEAKERVQIQRENQTLASITFQNYFRLYKKLSGMTGTADTEAFEFQSIYNLEVVVIPPNRKMLRKDHSDLVFISAKDKFEAVVAEIVSAHDKGQPVLVGTASIETSELLSGMLEGKGIVHQVLNAKHHAREAEIIAQAGMMKSVTIATNMAGRGTDIVLGGSLEAELHGIEADSDRAAIKADWQARHDAVVAAGGLYVIGSERHESRRIDNQLRGRSGRQGDPGASRFFLSLDDTLMRIFTPPRMRAMLQGLGMQAGEAIEHRWVNRAIETAQRKVEAHHFDIRKNLLDYDNVANEQRKAIYELRDDLMGASAVSDRIDTIFPDVINAVIDIHIPPQSIEAQWNVSGLQEALSRDFAVSLPLQTWLDDDKTLDEKGLRRKIIEAIQAVYADKKARIGAPILEHYEKSLMLQVLDILWREHLGAMDYLRQGIHLRGYAQKDPKQEYKREAFTMFTTLLGRFKHDVISTLSRINIQSEAEVEAEAEALEAQRRQAGEREMHFAHPSEAEAGLEEATETVEAKPQPVVNEQPRLGRNEPCWCGSGKKYKHCHGKLET
jgi:preprotein translocase subunit SecA